MFFSLPRCINEFQNNFCENTYTTKAGNEPGIEWIPAHPKELSLLSMYQVVSFAKNKTRSSVRKV